MKKIFLFIMIILFIIACNSDNEQKQNSLSKHYETISKKNKQDTVKVEFGNRLSLYWDCVNNKIIEDENYFMMLNNRIDIHPMARFITNEEVVCDYVHGKENSLKKGDVAYLFLSEYSRAIFDFERLGIRYGIDDCKHPISLLDCIEKNRDLISQKVMSYLDLIGIPRLTEKGGIIMKRDIVEIEFGNQFILHWDRVNDRIIKDENYLAILKDKNNIRSMAHFIANEEIVYDYICSKESALLKKGDIAYLFLSQYNHFTPTFKCLGIQFDFIPLPCGHPLGLLDYIESNRDLVSQKAISCLDKKGDQ